MSSRRQHTSSSSTKKEKIYNDTYSRTNREELLDLDIGMQAGRSIEEMNSRINSKANEMIREKKKEERRGRYRGKNKNSNTKNSIKMKSDYSADWNLSITKSVSSNIDNYSYLELLAATLVGLKQKTYPSIPPPKPTLLKETSNSDTTENDNNNSMINRFSVLNIIENADGNDNNNDSDDSEDVSDSDEDESNPNEIVISNNSTQVRYLLFKFLTTIAELHYKKADQLLSTSLWVECAFELEQAYQLLNSLVIKNGEWWAAVSSCEDDGTILDKHNMNELNSIIDAFDMVRECTGKQRGKSEGKLRFKLQMIREKLDPMLVERDVVKQSYGEKRWTSNPKPKMDYAAKRAEWEEKEKELMKAIGIIEPLHFI